MKEGEGHSSGDNRSTDGSGEKKKETISARSQRRMRASFREQSSPPQRDGCGLPSFGVAERPNTRRCTHKYPLQYSRYSQHSLLRRPASDSHYTITHCILQYYIYTLKYFIVFISQESKMQYTLRHAAIQLYIVLR